MPKRIDPTKIVELFRKHGVRPMFDRLMMREDQEMSACALGICLIEQDPRLIDPNYNIHGSEHRRSSSEILGLEPSYVTSFTHGFDGKPFDEIKSASNLHGWEDGMAARKAVLESNLLR